MKTCFNTLAATLVCATAIFSSLTSANAADSWTFPVLAMDKLRDSATLPFTAKKVDYKSLDSSEVTKKWNLCFLAPHTTNEILRSYLYGTVEETKRLGAKLTVFDAGGYGNLDKQLAQFDDCVTLGANAIMIMAVSPTAFNQKIAEARAKGIKVVDVNVGIDGPVDGRAVVTYIEVGKIIGEALAAKHPAGSGKQTSLVLPGPAGVSWSEDTAKGYLEAIKGSDVASEKTMYGGSSRLEQQPLVEDGLVTYPGINYIVGIGTAIEAVLNALREQGRVGEIGLYGSFITPDLIKPIENGEVAGVVVENSIVINKMAVDMTIRLLENKAKYTDAIPAVTLVDKSNVADVPAANFAPSDWKVQLSVD
ncbi:TMAO reductase system protein TorT [Rhizobium leguminosarum]|uniref:TMAO reductase system protein TorT n=1 Tax=Rhizobium leguminosarum TaxID=384 RepID=UPI0024A8F690|nr:TMAO reductase system protein TorT [Rhizobium leguminosarum]MDI5929166.1 TMAO reductase system protein TorT [Rhizobium leguminosarum]